MIAGIGCSLIVSHADSECSSNRDCERFAGTVCAQGACVAGAAVVDAQSESPPITTSCTTTQDCLPEHGGVNWICRKSDGTCVSVVSTDCASIAGQYTSDDAILVGALLPLLDPYTSIGRPLKNALALAASDFQSLPARTDGGARRPLAVVFCDDTQNPDRAAKHLHDDLGVPVVLGTAFSADTLTVAHDVTVPDGQLLFSPAAGSDLSSVMSSGLVWRSIPSDTYQAAAMSQVVNTVLEPEIKTKNQLANVRVAVVHSSDLYGQQLDALLTANLVINGMGAADARTAGYFVDADYGNPFKPPDTQIASAIAQVTTGALPDIIVIVGYTLGVTQVLSGIESAWPPSAPRRPQYLVSNGMQVQELLTLLGALPGLRTRILGTAPGSDPKVNSNLAGFAAHYRQTFADGTFPESYAAANAYDALYTVAYGIAATANPDLVGKDVLAGLRRNLMADSGQPVNVDVSPSAISTALSAIASHTPIALHGASGLLAYDPMTGDLASDVQVWCVIQDAATQKLVFETSGLSYLASSAQLAGTLDTSCTK